MIYDLKKKKKSNFLLPKIGDTVLPKPLVTYSASPNSLKDEYHRAVYMGDLSECYFLMASQS